MNQQPSTSLREQAAGKIEQAFPEQHTETTRIIWWDDGGYLKEIIQDAASDLGVDFRAATEFPLDLRIGAVDDERQMDQPQVWYVADGKDGRDWFRDIRETGGEIICSIEELTAEVYDVNPWDIFDVERRDAEERAEAANIILDRFSSFGIPQYDPLKEAILTKGGGQLLDHLLRDGWPEISRDEATVDDVRTRLRDNHNIPIPNDADPERITDAVRRWAVAQSLIDSGVNADVFGDGYHAAGYSELTSLLQTRGDSTIAHQYLGEQYWPDVIADLEQIWAYASCPVDAALDTALWEAWYAAFESEEYAECIENAQYRQKALSAYPEDTAWVRLWYQSERLARLQQYFTEWESSGRDTDPFETYADEDEGSWRIDNEVLQLQLTGTPEADIQRNHPARTTLPDERDTLLTTRYREYLETLAEAVTASMQVGAPFVDKEPAYEWWTDHEDEFDDLGTVAIFLIDALRFDLAQRLADRLSDDFEVKQDTRLATLPTETKFGMAALTPGRSFRFNLGMDGDTLSVSQGQRSLPHKQSRKSFYEDEGWEVPDDLVSGWEHHHIAYYDKELDDVGEGEIGDIESHFGDYIDDLADIIHGKLTDENWDRIYVVTDHGFVLLPDDTPMESISVSAADTEVKYRRVAGDELDDLGSGVHLPPTTAGLDYLDTSLQLLVSPYHHFSKQGYGDTRFYHGGLLPQECMLSFLEIEA